MDELTSTPTQSQRHTLTLRLDLRWIVALLLLVIIIMTALWQPWKPSTGANSRTITVSGEATVKAEPDEFVFSPTYTITNSDREAALKLMADKTTELTNGLKATGVQDNQIKSNIDSYSREIYYPTKPGETPSYSLQLTITVNQRQQAQKVQDYLAKTTPTGTITPYANFSDTKRKQLESEARNLATKDARSKADQSAGNLGFKIGSVKSVSDGSGFGNQPCSNGICFAEDRAVTSSDTPSQIGVQPGQNSLQYSVSVEYYLR